MPTSEYVYRITDIVKVTDGDTFWVRVDVGFRQNILINVRLHGYDCPEAHKGSDYEKSKAVEAREVARTFLGERSVGQLWIRTMKDPDNFGRWLGEIWWEETTTNLAEGLGEHLHYQELATVWPTRWRDVYDVKAAE